MTARRACTPDTVGGLISQGARLIFHALLSMAERHGDKARGLVEHVVLLGGTMTRDPDQWRLARSVVCGRLVNGHSGRD